MPPAIEKHKPPRVGYRETSTQRGYGTAHRVLRKWWLARHPQCEDCNEPATELDHIDGNNKNTHPTNLASRCSRCHKRKSVMHDGGFGRPRA